LIKFLLVSPVRTLDFPVQAWSPGFNIDMPDAEIMQMPMEVSLELIPVVCANGMDPEGKPGNNIIDKSDGITLGVSIIDFQGTDSRRIVDGRILESFYGRAVGPLDCQKLYIRLDIVTGNLLLVPVSNNGPLLCVLGETVQSITLENPVDAPRRDFHPVVAFKIPGNPPLA
jgi:hypothetical protein